MKFPFKMAALLCAGLALSLPNRLLGTGNGSDVPPPTAPFVAAVPDSADWTLTVKLPTQPASAEPAPVRSGWRIVEVHSTRKGKLKRDIITYANGTKAERWFADNLLFWKSAEGSVIANNLSGNSADPDLAANTPSIPSGFFGADWLKQSFYDQVVPVEKRPCYHFASPNKEAWIDVESKLPVACKLGDVVYRYTFNAPPEALAFPPDFQKAWNDYQAMANRGKDFQQKLKAGQAH